MAADCRARPRALRAVLCLGSVAAFSVAVACNGGTGAAPGADAQAGTAGGPANGGNGGNGGNGRAPGRGGGNGAGSGGMSGASGAGGQGGAGGGTGGAAGSGGQPAMPDASATDGSAGTPDGAGACNICQAWGSPQLLGQVRTAGLDALSGLAASWRNPGVLYVHNDRARPQVFALTEAGALLARFTLDGALVSDVEDIEVGRCPAGTCLLLGDLGNNVNPRTEFAIYRATEPAIDPAGATAGTAVTSLAAERFAFSYADGPHNAESLILDHASGAVYVVTKEAPGAASAAYRLESFQAGQLNRATKVADLPIPAATDSPITAGSGHPCAPGLLLRTNNRLVELRAAAGGVFADAFRAMPVALPAGTEVQGEAVSFRADGRAYYTTSEGPNPPIHRVTCR